MQNKLQRPFLYRPWWTEVRHAIWLKLAKDTLWFRVSWGVLNKLQKSESMQRKTNCKGLSCASEFGFLGECDTKKYDAIRCTERKVTIHTPDNILHRFVSNASPKSSALAALYGWDSMMACSATTDEHVSHTISHTQINDFVTSARQVYQTCFNTNSTFAVNMSHIVIAQPFAIKIGSTCSEPKLGNMTWNEKKDCTRQGLVGFHKHRRTDRHWNMCASLLTIFINVYILTMNGNDMQVSVFAWNKTCLSTSLKGLSRIRSEAASLQVYQCRDFWDYPSCNMCVLMLLAL